jgi:hypothetical protein
MVFTILPNAVPALVASRIGVMQELMVSSWGALDGRGGGGGSLSVFITIISLWEI